MRFTLRVSVGLFLSLLAINQVSAKLGALEVLEGLRQNFETPSKYFDAESQQYHMATAAIQMIVMTRLSDSFQRYNGFTIVDKNDLHGTPSSELSKAPYQSFGLASDVATVFQKTRYVEWFLKAALLKVDVGDILEKAAFLPEITGSVRGRNHLEACRQLWALTTKVAEKKDGDVVNPYFNSLDPTITGGGDFRAFYNKLATSRIWPPCYDHHGKAPTQELERKQEYQKQEIDEGLALGQSIETIKYALINRDTQRTTWAKASLERAEWVLEIKEQKERQRAANEKAIQAREKEAQESVDWRKALQARRARENAERERETRESVDQERKQWENDLVGTITIKMTPSEDELWEEEVRERQRLEAEARQRAEREQTEREEKRRLQLKKDRRKHAVPELTAYLDSWAIGKGAGPLQIILQYLSTKDRDELLPCIPYIQVMRDQSTLDKIVSGGFMSLGGASSMPTIELEDWAEKIPGADGSTLYLQLDLRRVIPEKELGADHSLLLFNVKSGGSWRGNPKQLEFHKGTPGSLTIHLDNGNLAHIQRGVVDNEGKTINRIVLRTKEPEKIPDLATILASLSLDSLKLINDNVNLHINRVYISLRKIKFLSLLQYGYQIEQVTDERTGVQYNMAYPTWKSFLQVDLNPTTSFQFSEDQRYLMCRDQRGLTLLLDTLKCRIEDTICNVTEKEILVENPRVRVEYWGWRGQRDRAQLRRYDAITQQKLNHTDYRITDILNAAFSPSCDSFFTICGVSTPGQYALQEIDAETLIPRSASTAHLPLISLPGSREDVIRGGYLKSIGNMLLYFCHDGRVMRWKLGYQ